MKDNAPKITREEAIAYINTLGDPVEWGDKDLEEIREEVKAGDEYDGMNIWGRMLDELERSDI